MACGVLLAHALLLWVAITLHFDRTPEDDATPPVAVITMFRLPEVRGPLPDPARLDRPRLQELQYSQITLDPPEVPLPEDVASEPVTVETTVVADTPGAGSQQPGASFGQSGSGDGLVLLQRSVPAYPRAAERRAEQGITQVILHVTQSGHVDQVRVERSSGSALLDAAAVKAFRKWRFARLPDAPEGRWLRTAQRFILYQFTYSRLDAREMEFVYGENLKPKPGTGETMTPGSQDALLRFMAQLRDPAFDPRGAVSGKDLLALRANFGKWGATKSVQFMGIVGSGPWLQHAVKPAAGDGRDNVELSWNMFEVHHENAVTQWLIAIDRDGQVWAARAGQTSGKQDGHG